MRCYFSVGQLIRLMIPFCLVLSVFGTNDVHSAQMDVQIQDVKFIDANHGWVLLTLTNPDGSLNFQLAYAIDNGKSWTDHSLSLFETGDIASFAEKAEMGWFNSQSGWISIKQTRGFYFSIGTLFTTSDRRENWQRFTLPVA